MRRIFGRERGPASRWTLSTSACSRPSSTGLAISAASGLAGLMLVTSITYVAGWVIGDLALLVWARSPVTGISPDGALR